MRLSRPILFTGIVAALAGVSAVSAAERAKTHIMTVQLPDGRIGQVRYAGDTPPRIVLVQGAAVPVMPIAPAALFDTAFGPDSPFAEMDRQADAMMRQAAMMASAAPQPGTPQMTALTSAPAGTVSYSYVSTTSSANGKSCTTSVRMTSTGAGQQPQMLRNVSGDCGTAVQRQTGPSLTAAPATAQPAIKPTLVSAPAAPKAPVVRDSI